MRGFQHHNEAFVYPTDTLRRRQNSPDSPPITTGNADSQAKTTIPFVLIFHNYLDSQAYHHTEFFHP
jgi:hypothetical protein